VLFETCYVIKTRHLEIRDSNSKIQRLEDQCNREINEKNAHYKLNKKQFKKRIITKMFNKQTNKNIFLVCIDFFYVKWGVKEELTMICFVHFI